MEGKHISWKYKVVLIWHTFERAHESWLATFVCSGERLPCGTLRPTCKKNKKEKKIIKKKIVSKHTEKHENTSYKCKIIYCCQALKPKTFWKKECKSSGQESVCFQWRVGISLEK